MWILYVTKMFIMDVVGFDNIPVVGSYVTLNSPLDFEEFNTNTFPDPPNTYSVASCWPSIWWSK